MATQTQRKEQTRQALLDAAERAFSTHGFHGVSLEAIAEDAGYSKGAVYGRFTGKNDLFLAVVEQRFDRRLATLADWASTGTTLSDRLTAGVLAQSRAVDLDVAWTAAWVEFVAHATRHPETLRELRALDARLVARAGPELGTRLGLEGPDARYLTAVSLLIGSGLLIERLLNPAAIDDAVAQRLARALAADLEKGHDHE